MFGITKKKKGMGDLNKVLYTAIGGIILIVVLFKLYATMMPTAMAAGNELNTSGVPLGSLFGNGGIIFIIIMAALLIVVVGYFLQHMKHGRK